MLRNFNGVLGFEHTHTGRTERSAQGSAPGFWTVVSALRAAWGDLREGLAAHREYERLRARGVPHATALRESLGFGTCRSDDR